MRSFCSGFVRAKTRDVGDPRVQLASSSASSSSPVRSRRRRPVASMPSRRGDGRRGAGVVAGDHDRRDAGGAARGDGVGGLGARRVGDRRPGRRKRRLALERPRGRRAARRLTARRARARGSPRRRAERRPPRRRRDDLRRRPGEQRAAMAPRAPLTATQHRAVGLGGRSSSAAGSRRRRSRRIAGSRASSCARSTPSLAGEREQGALRGVAGERPGVAVPRRGRAARRRCRPRPPAPAAVGTGRSSRSGPGAHRRPARSPSPVDGVVARRRPDRSTVIRFSVSVPVLSVQITLTEPSVSTAGSRRMSARRSAMRRAPAPARR